MDPNVGAHIPGYTFASVPCKQQLLGDFHYMGVCKDFKIISSRFISLVNDTISTGTHPSIIRFSLRLKKYPFPENGVTSTYSKSTNLVLEYRKEQRRDLGGACFLSNDKPDTGGFCGWVDLIAPKHPPNMQWTKQIEPWNKCIFFQCPHPASLQQGYAKVTKWCTYIM